MHLQVLSKYFVVYAVSTLFSSLTESGRKRKPESSCCFPGQSGGSGGGETLKAVLHFSGRSHMNRVTI